MADRTPQELSEALRDLASREWDPDCPATDAPTRICSEAANLLSGLEEREEWRVVGERDGKVHPLGVHWTPEEARQTVAFWREPNRWPDRVRIQQRSRFVSPWTDVEGEG